MAVAAPWYAIQNAGDVPSPSLLIYPDRVDENIRRMVRTTGDARRLRPHLKTAKIAEVTRLYLAHGVTRFKVATIAEAEMAAAAGAPDVLIAYQLVGPNIGRFLQLSRTFPATTFSTVVDAAAHAEHLSGAAAAAGQPIRLYIDLDVGMHRTGIEPGPDAVDLYRRLAGLGHVQMLGLHAYDGHLHEADVEVRRSRSDDAFARVASMRDALLTAGLPAPAIVAGGSPTFPFHARRGDVECSPGTTVFWDLNYATNLPDLDFLPAVLVLTRVVSKPGDQRVCLDLGHKAIASENPHPRAALFDVPDALAVGHSEEHLLIETERAPSLQIGDALFALPWHVCPTVALYEEAVVVRDGSAVDRWRVAARRRAITI